MSTLPQSLGCSQSYSSLSSISVLDRRIAVKATTASWPLTVVIRTSGYLERFCVIRGIAQSTREIVKDERIAAS